MIVVYIIKGSKRIKVELTRWMENPLANLYVSNISVTIRDKLIDKISSQCLAIIIYTTNNDKGYEIIVT